MQIPIMDLRLVLIESEMVCIFQVKVTMFSGGKFPLSSIQILREEELTGHLIQSTALYLGRYLRKSNLQISRQIPLLASRINRANHIDEADFHRWIIVNRKV